MSNCTKRVRTEECTQTRDDGYNRCTQTRDDGYNRCSGWGWFSWICVFWTWVSNIVCVAWTWVSNIVCVAWKYIVQFVCIAIDVVVTVIGIITSMIDTIVGLIGGIVAFIVDLFTSIPIIGRFIDWVLGIAKTIVWAIASIPDLIGTLIGVMPEKKLRLIVLIQNDEQGNPLITDRTVIYRAIQFTINAYREQVNVRVIPVQAFRYASPFADEEVANDDYIATENRLNTPDLIDVCCDACEAGENLVDRGSQFNLKLSIAAFWGGARRLTGYGAPVVAFVVRSYKDGKAGCSLGPLTDFVTIKFQDSDQSTPSVQLTSDKSLGAITDLAHEVSHCCSLPQKEDGDNMMNPSPMRSGKMTVWQKMLVRSSRHVTYL
jgi:hypothetical protein